MDNMLKSVYNYNSYFIKNEDDKKRLRKILEAMRVVDRRFFVGAGNEGMAYVDTALSIGEGQTISQPSTVARMLFLAELKKGDDVLEVGGGSGWNACLISYLTEKKVVSLERINELAELAKENFNKLKNKIKNKKLKVDFVNKNVFFMRKKKFDRIIITAGISDTKVEKKVEKIAGGLLRDKGILVCPYVSGPMIVFRKMNGKIVRRETREEYVFVPLIAG